MQQLLPIAFQITGLVVILAVVAQVIVASLVTARRSLYTREQHVRSLDLLDNRIEAARQHRVASEQEAFTWQGFRKFEVQKKQPEGGDICSFYLKPHDGRPLPPFKAGQFLTFKLDIPGDKQITRCYSLSSIAPGCVKSRTWCDRTLKSPLSHDTTPFNERSRGRLPSSG